MENNIQDPVATITNGLQSFLTSYNQDSAYFINRFLTGYSKNNMKGILTHLSKNEDVANAVVKNIKSYAPINSRYIWNLYLFYEGLINQKPVTNEIVVYRGLRNLDERSLAGVNATSLDFDIACKFNRGTILQIHLPAGSQFIRLEEYAYDEEKQIILPPCDYEIICEEQKYIKGIFTRIVDVNVEYKDLLTAFAIAMHNPIQDYIIENSITNEYQEAFFFLTQIMIRRALNSYANSLVTIALDNKDVENLDAKLRGCYPYSDILLIDFIIQSSFLTEDIIIKKIELEFTYISPAEKEVLFSLVLKYKKEISETRI